MNPFGNVQFVPGVGHVEAPGLGKLAGEADVMMISGLGNDTPSTATMQNGQVVATTGTFKLGTALSAKVKLLGIELPLWAWVLIAAGALGAGWVFFGRKLMKK